MLLKGGLIKLAYKQCSNFVNEEEKQLTFTNSNAELVFFQIHCNNFISEFKHLI